MVCYPNNIIWPDGQPDDAASDDQIDVATSLGWTTLQVLSGYAFSLCPKTVRPIHTRNWNFNYYNIYEFGGQTFFPYVYNGLWYNYWCLDDNCQCTPSNTVILPEMVTSITNVQVDGTTIDPAAYRVDDGNRLVRQDGGIWPFRQNFALPDGEVGTFSVTYNLGAVDDIALRYAAGTMAAEYLLAMLGGECRLPAGTVQIVRQGVTIEFQPDFFQGGRTGIAEVDAVIARLNPYGTRGKSVMFNPDAKRARQTTFGG